MINKNDLTIGFGNKTLSILRPTTSKIKPLENNGEHLKQLFNRLNDVENALVLKPNIKEVLTEIRLTKNVIIIKAENIALVGDVTFLDYVKNLNGEKNNLDTKITRIVGDRVRTGVIESNNISTNSGTQIDLNTGEIKLGGTGTPGVHITAAGDAYFKGTVFADSLIEVDPQNTTTLTDLLTDVDTAKQHVTVTGSNPHNTALNQISGDLDDISNGSTYFKTTNTEKTGGGRAYQALNSSAKYIKEISTQHITVSGTNPATGVIFDQNGLRGYGNSELKFEINANTGNATFSGDVNTAGFVKATGGTIGSGGIASFIAQPTTASTMGFWAKTVNASAIIGISDNNYGVIGSGKNGGSFLSTHASGSACELFATNIALKITGGKITKPKELGNILKLYPTANPDEYEFEFI